MCFSRRAISLTWACVLVTWALTCVFLPFGCMAQANHAKPVEVGSIAGSGNTVQPNGTAATQQGGINLSYAVAGGAAGVGGLTTLGLWLRANRKGDQEETARLKSVIGHTEAVVNKFLIQGAVDGKAELPDSG